MEDNFADDLTAEELAAFESFTDPDEQSNENFRWDDEFQRYLLGMLVSDRFFAIQSRDLIRPEYFVDEVHQLMCRKLFLHIDEYHVLPSKISMRQEVQDQIADKDAKLRFHYTTEMNMVYDQYIPGAENRDYLLDKVTNFAKIQALKVAFNKSLSEMKKAPESESTWTKIQSLLNEAMLVDRNFDIGLDYFQSFDERYERMKQKEEGLERFTSGFDKIDDALVGGGCHRGEMYSWMGMPGTGKSLMLVTASIRNVVELGKRVLYVSLEMDQDSVAQRFDAQFSNINIRNLVDNENLVKKALSEQVEDVDDPRMLIVKQFASGDLTVNKLRAYLQQLAMVNFRPDLLVLDYIGEMKDDPNLKTYESRYRMVRDLRGLAMQENICIFTAMQPNKDARNAQDDSNQFNTSGGVIDDVNLADSFGQIRPLDGCWSINQTQDEKDAGVARIFVIKHRNGKSRFKFHVEYNMETLSISQTSADAYQQKINKIRNDKMVTADQIKEESSIKKKAKGFASDEYEAADMPENLR